MTTERAGLDADALERWASEEPGCRLLVLFGSAATGRDAERSDMDLALAFDGLPGPERRLEVVGELQDRCGSRHADVVFLRPETDPVLRFEIFRDGKPLYERRPGLFVEERVRAVMLYQDALPFRRALRHRLASGSGDPSVRRFSQ